MFKIGQKVKWTVGIVESKGVFLEEVENGKSTVITHFIGGQIANREIQVESSLLEIWN